MIAKIALFILAAIVLPHLYFDRTLWRKRRSRWLRLKAWLVAAFLVCFTIRLALERNYFPDDLSSLIGYLHLLMVYVVPAALLALCMALGRMLKSRFVARVLGWVLAVGVALVWVYGCVVGFRQFEVRQVELAFDDLPEAFDGYKIVQLSDAHVGTLTGSRQAILQRCVDSINAQHADLVAFTGDLQNMRPEEIAPHQQLLASIEARDGVFSVLGNHDYAEYIDADEMTKAENVGKTIFAEEALGWKMLLNSHRLVRRDSSTIVVAGMENDGEGRFPQKGNLRSTLYGLSRSSFVVMLEHDPTSWRRKILPHSHAQLTLSGHTHGMQFELFGWSPVSLRYREYDGTYRSGTRVLHVSKGLGGVIPFRFGAPGEIVVITLRSGSKVKA